jgi:integrase
MPMRNFTKSPIHKQGMIVFRLIDTEGDPDTPFDYYLDSLFDRGFAPTTIKRYLEVVANFLDYLVEANVYGTPVSENDLNRAINQYVRIRTRADQILASNNEQDEFVKRTQPLVKNLGYTSVAPSPSMTSAINRFLKLSDLLERSERERAVHLGIPAFMGDNQEVIQAIRGCTLLPPCQKKALAKASMLVNVMRLNPEGIEKPRGLTAARNGKFADDEFLDFPILDLKKLLDAASSWRDKALWILLASSGIRMSEACNLLWEHIDITNRKVFVEDPHHLRFARSLPMEVQLRFKGRAISDTYLIPVLRDHFFVFLEQYVKQECVPGTTHGFVFQHIRPGPTCGRPFHTLSDSARIETFKRAVKRANIQHPKEGIYTPHSLRHLYGVYMLNYLPVPGGYGLTTGEVQKLMGHKTEAATKHYAREDRVVLAAKLEYADRLVTLQSDDWQGLPAAIANRLKYEADKIQGVK